MHLNKLSCPCETRFATHYITLKRVVEEKTSLRSGFCDHEWVRSHLSRESKEKFVEETIIGENFWESTEMVIKMCEPIVDLLRVVDSC
jgi:hypothetical protein